MAKVTNPLHSGDASGKFGKGIIYRKGGIVTRTFTPRNPNSAAQQAQRNFFREHYVPSLTRAQADLLYAALGHLHNDQYAALVHTHDHGDLNGLTDDDHPQYFNQVRGDARYLRTVPQQSHAGLSGLSGDDHTQYYNQTRGDARYLRDAASDGNYYARKNGAWASVPATPWTTRQHTGAGGIVSSTVLTYDPQFRINVVSGGSYVIRGQIYYWTPSAADFKFKFSCPSDDELITKRSHILPNTSAIVSVVDKNTQPTQTMLGTGDGNGFIDFICWLYVGAGAKIFDFEYAQNTSNATPTRVSRGSYIEYYAI